MPPGLELQASLDDLAAEIKGETTLTSALFRRVVAVASARFPTKEEMGKTAGFEALVGVGAWCDAALALIELEVPQWKVRQLAYDDGEWFCSLSNQPNFPKSLDDTADASHSVLPLAILGAFLEALKRTVDKQKMRVPTVRGFTTVYALCCDNFA